MKKLFLVIALVFFFCGSAFAADADYCDMKYMKYVDAIKKSDKILDDGKKKYVPYLMKARDLCKAGNMEAARNVINEVRQEFFHDALMTHQAFFSN